MNAKTFIAAASILAAGSAFAQDVTFELPMHVSSTLTRAEVRADAIAARRAGLIQTGQLDTVTVASTSLKTRAQVQAEAREAVRLGLVDRGENVAVITAAQAESIRMAGLAVLPMVVGAR